MGRAINDKVLLLSLILFGAVVLLPVLSLIPSALNGESFGVLMGQGMLKATLNSLLISLSTATISTISGTCLAFLLTKTNVPFASAFKLLMLLPLFLPPYTFAVAWSDLLFNIDSQELFGNIPGVIFILIIIYTPVTIFIVAASLENIHQSIEEAGEMMKSYRTVFFKIVLPLIRPALLSSFSLIFVLSISEFSVPSYLSVPVLTSQIFVQFTAFYDYASAISQSLVLIVICLLLIFPGQKFLRKGSFWGLGRRGFHLKKVELKPVLPWLILCIIYLLFTQALPLSFLVSQSFQNGSSEMIQASTLLFPEVLRSIILSLEGALILLFFGYTFAKLTLRDNWRWLDYISLLLFAIPSTVTGIALTRFFNTSTLNFVYSSSLILLIAYLARFVFISQKILLTSLLQVPDSYEEAAILTGASKFKIFFRIHLPLLSEGIFSAFCICFLFCLSELGASIMVYPPGTSLLPVKVFTLMANSSQALVSSMNVVVLAVSLLSVGFLFLTNRLVFNTSWR